MDRRSSQGLWGNDSVQYSVHDRAAAAAADMLEYYACKLLWLVAVCVDGGEGLDGCVSSSSANEGVL